MQKCLLILKIKIKIKKYVEEIENKISDLKKIYKNAKETLEIINKIIDYKNNASIFFIVHQKLIKKSEPKIEKNIAERTKLRIQKDKEFIKNIENKSKTINYNLFKEYFKFGSPTALTKQLFETKNENKNNDLVNVIKSGLIDLKKEIEKASEEEIELEKPNEIVKIVEEILEFNRKKNQEVA